MRTRDEIPSTIPWRRTGGALAAFAVAAGLVVATPAAATSATAKKGTVKTSGARLWVRSGPSRSHKAVGSLANRTRVTITCQVTGGTVSGTYGTSALWDKIGSGRYVSDANVYTGSDARVAPTCGGSPGGSPGGSSGSGKLVDDYPYKNASWNQADPWNFYKRECVSFAAWRIRQRNKVAFTNSYKGQHWGNANHWDNAARAAGIKVNNTAKAGAVAQWNSGTYGHVAWVARVSSGKVTIEEYNKGGTHRYGTRVLSKSSVENYIHIGD